MPASDMRRLTWPQFGQLVPTVSAAKRRIEGRFDFDSYGSQYHALVVQRYIDNVMATVLVVVTSAAIAFLAVRSGSP